MHAMQIHVHVQKYQNPSETLIWQPHNNKTIRNEPWYRISVFLRTNVDTKEVI